MVGIKEENSSVQDKLRKGIFIYFFRTCSIFITLKDTNMITSLKEKIIKLRKDGMTYDEIKLELNCSKSTISYHCKNNLLNNNGRTHLSKEDKIRLKNYYKTHSLNETALEFNIGRSTVIKHTENKLQRLTDGERRIKNYNKVKLRRRTIKDKAIEYKGGGCEKCGYNKCNRALEFHHLNPNEKDFGISSSSSILSWDKIKEELDKCILVCANCHREIHEEIHNRDVSPRTDTA